MKLDVDKYLFEQNKRKLFRISFIYLDVFEYTRQIKFALIRQLSPIVLINNDAITRKL